MSLERIPGDKARGYRDTETGAIVSRHTAEIRPRLTQLGYTNAHQRADIRKQFAYANDGKGLREKQEKLWNAARSEGFSKATKNKAGVNVGPQSKIAQFLVSIGIRDAGADYDVGETPK